MNILHIAGKLDPRLGGVAQAIRTIVAGLEDMGFHNEVVSLDNPQAPFLSEIPFTIHTPGEGRSAWYYSARLLPWLQLNCTRFERIIVHGLWQYHGYAIQKTLRHLKKKDASVLPVVYVMPHGMLDPYFQAVKGRRLKAIRNWCYWQLIEKNLVNGAGGLLFTSLEEQMLASMPFRPYKPKQAAVTGLGVRQPPLFTGHMQKAFLSKCPEARNRNYLLFLGRIAEKKGVDLLLEAYGTIAAGHYDESEENDEMPMLVIAGPGLDTPYGKKINKMVSASRQLQSLVAFTGMLSGDAKWGAFYCADAFILPSHQENFGVALVEALACGKPALISNKVNIWREVIETQGGIIEDDTAAGTLSLLNRWMTLRPEQQKLMAVRARQCYERQFSVEMASKRMLRALGIDHKPARRPSNFLI